MRAEPGQPERQRQGLGRAPALKAASARREAHSRDDQGCAVDDDTPGGARMEQKRKHRDDQQYGDAVKRVMVRAIVSSRPRLHARRNLPWLTAVAGGYAVLACRD